jgi:hypothetical protein
MVVDIPGTLATIPWWWWSTPIAIYLVVSFLQWRKEEARAEDERERERRRNEEADRRADAAGEPV